MSLIRLVGDSSEWIAGCEVDDGRSSPEAVLFEIRWLGVLPLLSTRGFPRGINAMKYRSDVNEC